ncbi:hypothetical protein Dsin_003091 [Dipteronia sinensis]|uniref:Uncharacterized protein n=1 Tax=Dipteronia sinensis TaxID=43782 RepID=A0AAE0B8C9_9ROSI|nr:hypothetical protein Dsin_003091 [Dipteronia sinensis]
MNLSASQCSSSGCESGWTLYLDQSSLSKNQCYSIGGIVDEEGNVRDHEKVEEEEEEDLSMVSDASSGPRHYCEDDEDCFYENGCFSSPPSASELAKKSKNKKKKIKEQHGRNQQHSYLDDTASSPLLGFSKKNISFSKKDASMEHVMDFSQGFSATHLKSSLARKPASGEIGGLQGRKWE